jgi:effector-binding domain-containing protein
MPVGRRSLQENAMSRLGAAIVIAGMLSLAGPAAAQSIVPATPAQAQPADPFGVEVMLEPKTIVAMKGSATWDTAFETLVDTFKTLYAYLGKEGIKPAGPAITIYTATDDTGFQYQAGIPIEQEPRNMPGGDIAVAKTPEGRALKFVHRGSYDAMDTTYDAITNHLDEKRLEARELFMEQYVTDPLNTPEDKLVIEVFVPIK